MTERAHDIARRIAALEEKTKRERDLFWSSATVDYVCGLPTRPLTMRAVVDLTMAGNALFNSSEPAFGDLAALLWRLSPCYGKRFQAWHKWRLTRRLKKIGRNRVYYGVLEFLDSSYRETAENTKGAKGEDNGLPRLNPTAAIIDALCNQYGMSQDAVLDMPLANVWQLLRCINTRTNPDYRAKSVSHDLRSKYLEELNASKNEG